MIRTFFLIMLSLFGLCLISCSEGDETVIARFDENGAAFSPAVIQGAVEYANTMIPSGVRLVLLNSDLDSIDMVELPVKGGIISIGGVGSSYSYSFRSEPLYLESPLVKVVSIFSEDGVDMEFCQYLNVVGGYAQLQHLVGALAFDRETYLMKKEGYKYEDAKTLAESELKVAFGMVYGSTVDPLLPYFYCRYFESDSVFYSDFEELKKRYQKGELLDSAIKLHVADGALRFQMKISDSGDDYKMSARDSLMDKITDTYAILWDEVYGTHMYRNSDSIGSLQTVQNEKSDFDGRHFLRDGHKERHISSLSWTMWRLVSPLEDSIGICLYDSSHIKQYKDDYYVCAKDSYIWQKTSERDTILSYLYGVCDRHSNTSRVRVYQDTMYHCHCESDAHCGWTEYEPTTDSSNSTALREEFVARAVYAFGECEIGSENEGKKFQLDDSTYVRCNSTWGMWESISYEEFWMPSDATVGQVGVLPDGRYVKYEGYSKWKVVDPPEYYGNVCNSSHGREVVFCDSTYYMCIPGCSGNCWSGYGDWKVLSEEEANPPTIQNIRCDGYYSGLMRQYDSTVYVCADSVWIVTPDSLLTSPVKDGHLCNAEFHDSTLIYDDGYFQCDTAAHWSWKMYTAQQEAAYDVALKAGKCSETVGTSVYLSDKVEGVIGCSSWGWKEMKLPISPYQFPEELIQELPKGKFISNNTYQVDIGEMTYLLKTDGSNLLNYRMIIGETEYGSYFYNNHLFVHALKGSDKVKVDLTNTTEKSESFDDFYAQWKTRVRETSQCGERNVVQMWYLAIYDFSPESYVTWEKASTFCPAGFHVPSSEEFMLEDYLRYMGDHNTTDGTVLGYSQNRNDNPITVGRGDLYNDCRSVVNMYYNIFWTSDEKDETTHYCAEQANRTDDEYFKMQIVECPKDLFPMVQVICVKD